MPKVTLKQTVKNHFNITKQSDDKYMFKDILQERWNFECNIHGTVTKLPEDIAQAFLIYNLPYAYNRLKLYLGLLENPLENH